MRWGAAACIAAFCLLPALGQDEWAKLAFEELRIGQLLDNAGIKYVITNTQPDFITVRAGAQPERRIGREEYAEGAFKSPPSNTSALPTEDETTTVVLQDVPFGSVHPLDLRTGLYIEINDDWGIVKLVRPDGSITYRPKAGFEETTVSPPYKHLKHVPPRERPAIEINPHPQVTVAPVEIEPGARLDFARNLSVVTIPIRAPALGKIVARRLVKLNLVSHADLLPVAEEQKHLRNGTIPEGFELKRSPDGGVVFSKATTFSWSQKFEVPALISADSLYLFEVELEHQQIELRSYDWLDEPPTRDISSRAAVVALIQIQERPELSPRVLLEALAANHSEQLLGHLALFLCNESTSLRARAAQVLQQRDEETVVDFLGRALTSSPISVSCQTTGQAIEQRPVPDEALFLAETIQCLRKLDATRFDADIFPFLGNPDFRVSDAVQSYFSDFSKHLIFLVDEWAKGGDRTPWIEQLLTASGPDACVRIASFLREMGAPEAKISAAEQSPEPVKACLELYADWLRRIFPATRLAQEPGWKEVMIDFYTLGRQLEKQAVVRNSLSRKAERLASQVAERDRFAEIQLLERAFVLDASEKSISSVLGIRSLEVAGEMLGGSCIRKEPSPFSQIVQYLKLGDTVVPASQEGGNKEWIAVRGNGGFEGWIHHSAVNPELVVEASARRPEDVELRIATALAYDPTLGAQARSMRAKVHGVRASQFEATGEWGPAYEHSLAAWNEGASGFPLTAFLFANWDMLLGGLLLAIAGAVGLSLMQRRTDRAQALGKKVQTMMTKLKDTAKGPVA